MTFLYGVLIFIATIIFALITHEFGHYLMAKRFGVIADEFSIGMGKKAIFSFTKGKTKWSIRLIPIGAYCDFEDKPGGLCDLAPGKRIAVFLAGPLTNIFSGMVFFVIGKGLIGANPLRAIGDYFASGFGIIGRAFAALGKVFNLETYSNLNSNGAFTTVLKQYSGVQAVALSFMIAAIVIFILGLSNLFPIPSFDGGHILFAIPELFGKKITQKTVNKINYISFMLITILSLMILAEVGLGMVYGSIA